MHKRFGQRDWINLDTGELGYGAKRPGMGYFIRYCECRRKLYLTDEEIWRLVRATSVPIPIVSVLRERFVRRMRIPKLSLVVEWRRLDELKKMPLGKKEQMAALQRSGYSLRRIGDKYGLSRSRVCQILKGA